MNFSPILSLVKTVFCHVTSYVSWWFVGWNHLSLVEIQMSRSSHDGHLAQPPGWHLHARRLRNHLGHGQWAAGGEGHALAHRRRLGGCGCWGMQPGMGRRQEWCFNRIEMALGFYETYRYLSMNILCIHIYIYIYAKLGSNHETGGVSPPENPIAVGSCEWVNFWQILASIMGTHCRWVSFQLWSTKAGY